MDLTRREFALAAAAGFAARAADVRLHFTGTAGRRGADLGIDEMSRTAMLLGGRLRVTDEADAIRIDLDEGRLLAEGAAFHVAASGEAKRAALAAWQRQHGAAGHAAAEWHPDLEKFGGGELNERFSRRFDAGMEAADWIGWMLVKISVETTLRAVPIARARFDGHKGTPLVFGPDRRLVQPLCIVDKGGRLLGITDVE